MPAKQSRRRKLVRFDADVQNCVYDYLAALLAEAESMTEILEHRANGDPASPYHNNAVRMKHSATFIRHVIKRRAKKVDAYQIALGWALLNLPDEFDRVAAEHNLKVE